MESSTSQVDQRLLKENEELRKMCLGLRGEKKAGQETNKLLREENKRLKEALEVVN